MSTYQRSRREAIIAGAIWLFFAVWTITVSYLLGYTSSEQTTTLGLPTWIVWGVLVPWVSAVVVNSVFAFFVLANDEPN